MLFNSYVFVLAFLPLTLIGFFLIGAGGRSRAAVAWLVAASLLFYAWWNPVYLLLIGASILVNYGLGLLLLRVGGQGQPRARAVLGVGIAANLALLGYFKYANFFVDTVTGLGAGEWQLEPILLPLAISFFTFQQVAYVVDVYRGEARETDFLHYCLFVTFFPQLIAGPIVHHREMLPQFADLRTFRFSQTNLAVGLTLFTMGLLKKVVLADGAAVYASPVFDAAAQGIEPSFFEAWGATLAYSLQLYFDFSGYSDMAVGLARLFGVRLPINFNAPYKAANIIDFWRRWHITLSRFLRDYLYFPLGGNRLGSARRYLNLLLTMLLGGLWHGAGWTFLLWGGLHGLYLVVNHAWHRLRRGLGQDLSRSTLAGRMAAQALTLLAVALAWVLFRSADLETAGRFYVAVFGGNGIGLPAGFAAPIMNGAPGLAAALGLRFDGAFPHELAYWPDGIPLLVGLTLVALFAPTAYQLLRRYRPVLLPPRLGRDALDGRLPRWLAWRAAPLFALPTLLLLIYSLLQMTSVSEFLYFQF